MEETTKNEVDNNVENEQQAVGEKTKSKFSLPIIIGASVAIVAVVTVLIILLFGANSGGDAAGDESNGDQSISDGTGDMENDGEADEGDSNGGATDGDEKNPSDGNSPGVGSGNGKDEEDDDANNYTRISTAAQLMNISLDGSYVLTNDIDLGGMEWAPIGSKENAFNGIFDGCGYVISNFKITDPLQYLGFFANNSGEIKNLSLVDFYIDVYYPDSSGEQFVYVGGLTGNNDGSISNCYIDGNITVETYRKLIDAGGITGHSSGSIYQCHSDGKVYAYTPHGICIAVGGLAGITYSSYTTERSAYNIDSCYSNMLVEAYASGGTVMEIYCGGLVGDNFGGIISNSYSGGDVIAEVDCFNMAGGLVGRNAKDTYIDAAGVIDNCYSYGNIKVVTKKNTNHVGGLVGSNQNGVIESSFCFGSINYTYVESSFSGHFSGNVVGSLWHGENKLSQCFFMEGQSIIANGSAYTPTEQYGESRSVSEFNSSNFYTECLGWDPTVWNIENLDFAAGIYPTLVGFE